MRKALRTRAAVWASLSPLILIAFSAFGAEGASGSLSLPLGFVLWGAAAALAALHRPLGGATLGLGTLVLPAAVQGLGVFSAALLAGIVSLLATRLKRWAGRREPATSGLGRELIAAAMAAAATLAGGALLATRVGGGAPFVSSAAWAAVVYVACFILIAVAGDRVRNATWRRLWPTARLAEHPALVLDAAGWVLGALLADMASVLGWQRVAPILLALVLLAAEAARNAIARGVSDYRVDNLERLQQAHERILSETSGMGAIAQQILIECCNILPIQWFQFELLSNEEVGQLSLESRSWSAGPTGVLEEGQPQPEARPRMLPGVHRRAAWRILEKPLVVEGEALAKVRLWCDPRRIETGSEELFSTLVPQMASSVHRARLDREARLDPLTGVPVRRILDSAMQRAYRKSCEEGRSMAVIMCDVDHFKKVNDTHGHVAGDEALIEVAKALDAQRREHDLLSRYGGEEFTVLLEDTAGSAALQLAERLRAAVEAIDLVYEGRRIPLTLSAGVAAFPELHIKTASELLLLADEALYESKERGRNRCLLHLGYGAFRAVGGETLAPPQPPAKTLPRIFG